MGGFNTDFDVGFDIGVGLMAIDPDVQVLIDALEARIAALEQEPSQQPKLITLQFPDGTVVSYQKSLV